MAAVTAAAVAGTAITAGASAYSANQQKKAMKSAGKQMDYGLAYRQSVDGQIAAMPDVLAAEGEFGPQFQQLELAAAGRGAKGMAELMFEINDVYGPQYLDQAMEHLKRVDPEGVAAREKLHGMVMEDAEAGGKLSDAERREVQQSVRKGQAARGNILGDANAYEEAMETGSAAWRRRQSAMQNLSNFMNGPTPQQGIAQLPQTPFMPTTGPGGMDRGAAAGGASSIYQGQQNLAQMQASQPNPWMQGLGMAAGAGAQIYGAHISSQPAAGVPMQSALPAGYQFNGGQTPSFN